MSKHQIIYTSCRHGLYSVEDGQQIFSHDKDFINPKHSDITALQSYTHPKSEQTMTDELALTMPKSFTYRKVLNNMSSFTLNTYLGRDYVGPHGRFGNIFSHSIVCDENEINTYPCEYYNSSMLLDHLDNKLLSNSEKPEYLPTPDIKIGYSVDVDGVIEFLSEGNRMDIYKKMIYSMLAFSIDKKRLLICDEKENIIMWIAALEYALPLKNILQVNFTTYEYRVENSGSRICGVMPHGTPFDPYATDSNFIFDIFNGNYPKIDFNEHSDFFDFVNIAMGFSFDSMIDFHEFVKSNTSYDGVDLRYINAYCLYCLYHDGLSKTNYSGFTDALKFANSFAYPAFSKILMEKLLSEIDIFDEMDTDYIISVIKYILSNYNILDNQHQEIARKMTVGSILSRLNSSECTEKMYIAIYETIREMCSAENIDVSKEMMLDKNRQKFDEILANNTEMWRSTFVAKIMCNNVKQNKELIANIEANNIASQMLKSIVTAIYRGSTNNGISVICMIMDELGSTKTTLAKITLFLQSILNEIDSSGKQTEIMWMYYVEKIAHSYKNDHLEICKSLLSNNLPSVCFNLYLKLITDCENLFIRRRIFTQHMNNIAYKNPDYCDEYIIKILKGYYDCIMDGDKNPGDQMQILDVMMENKLDNELFDIIAKSSVENLPLASMERPISNSIISIFLYQVFILNRMPYAKQVLLSMGIMVEEMRGRYPRQARKTFNDVSSKFEINISNLDKKTLSEYLKWVVPEICKNCKNREDFKYFYDSFNIQPDISDKFISIAMSYSISAGRKSKNFAFMYSLIDFALSLESREVDNVLGNELKQLNKNKLEECSQIISNGLKGQTQYLKRWQKIIETASAGVTLFSRISKKLHDD